MFLTTLLMTKTCLALSRTHSNANCVDGSVSPKISEKIILNHDLASPNIIE